MKLSQGATHYLVTALWSTIDYSNSEDDGCPLDSRFDVSDISESFQKQSQKDYDTLYALIQNLLTEDELNFETIGHDFWLTRNSHGAGFWDGDYVNGKEITAIVKKHFKGNEDDLREAINYKVD